MENLVGQLHNEKEMIMSREFTENVLKFTQLSGGTIDQFNVRQTSLYIGLQLEEMAEKLEALRGWKNATLVSTMHHVANEFKLGSYDDDVNHGDREEMLDADIDLAWVTIGSALSQGADVSGAMDEVSRANLDKFPGGVVTKDTNGKVVKPAGWVGPDLTKFIKNIY